MGEAGQGYTIVNQKLRLRILSAIDSALTGKGYRKVDSSSAQFLARYAVGVKTTSANVPVVNDGPDAPVPMTSCNAGGCWNGWDYGYNTPGDPAFAGITEREAGVVLELIDQKTGAVAWRGVYRDDATGKAPTPERIKKADRTADQDAPARALTFPFPRHRHHHGRHRRGPLPALPGHRRQQVPAEGLRPR